MCVFVKRGILLLTKKFSPLNYDSSLFGLFSLCVFRSIYFYYFLVNSFVIQGASEIPVTYKSPR